MYFIGIDGGGTKSEYTLMDENYKLIASCQSGATNINSSGYDHVFGNIEAGLNKLLEDAKLDKTDIDYLCLGSAGVDRESDKTNYNKILDTLEIKDYLVVNDSDVALSAGTKGKPGIIVIAGTGSIVYGVNGDKTGRVGGWGHLIGDEGSAYSIAEAGIRKAIQHIDGYGKKTVLADALVKAIGGTSVEDFIEFIYVREFNKDRIANLSQVVDKAANEGDSVSKEILLNSSVELFNQVDALIGKLFEQDETIRLVFNGSVIKKSNIFRTNFLELLNDKYSNVEVNDLSVSASIGAVYLAKGMC